MQFTAFLLCKVCEGANWGCRSLHDLNNRSDENEAIKILMLCLNAPKNLLSIQRSNIHDFYLQNHAINKNANDCLQFVLFI